MLGQRRRRWANIRPVLAQRLALIPGGAVVLKKDNVFSILCVMFTIHVFSLFNSDWTQGGWSYVYIKAMVGQHWNPRRFASLNRSISTNTNKTRIIWDFLYSSRLEVPVCTLQLSSCWTIGRTKFIHRIEDSEVLCWEKYSLKIDRQTCVSCECFKLRTDLFRSYRLGTPPIHELTLFYQNV